MLHKVLCKVGNAEGVGQGCMQRSKSGRNIFRPKKIFLSVSIFKQSEQVFVDMLFIQEVSMK